MTTTWPAGAQRRNGRFLNPDGTPAGQTLANVWRLYREALTTEPWPARIQDPPQPPPPEEVPPGQVAASFIGHSTFLLRLPGGTSVLTDPVFADRVGPFGLVGPRRARAPAIALAALPRIDAVLLSHNHYDHADLVSLRALHQRWRPAVLTGLGNAAWLARNGIPGAVELDWWQEAPLPGGHRARYVPARHFAARGILDRARTLWGGFALQLAEGQGRVFFAGDTAYGAHLAEIGRLCGPFDLALLPIGAYEPRWFMQVVHTTPEEAVQAMRDLRARQAIAMHFGTYRLTREPIGEPAQRLEAARGALDFRVPAFGETIRAALAGQAAPASGQEGRCTG
jgi:L-ascorbate metabolism protein UlaG (beta-lactamase superfamily)